MKNFIIFICTLITLLSGLFADWIQSDGGKELSYFRRIECFDTNNCVLMNDYLFVSGSAVRVTSDAGKTWVTTLNDNKIVDYNGIKLYPTTPFDISYPSKNTCIMVCDSGTFWVSKDACKTWKKSCLPYHDIWHQIQKITMYDENFGGLLTSRQLYLTHNGGINWDSVEVKPQDYQYTPSALQYLQIAGDSILIINAYRPDKESYIIRSMDLGKTWEPFPKTQFRIGDILFFNKDTGWAPGTYKVAPNTKSDVIFKTTDGGTTWIKKLDTLIEYDTHGLRKILFSDNKNGLAFGEHYYFWRTNDGGETWNKDTSFSEFNNDEILSDISMPSSNIQFGVQFYGRKAFKYRANPTDVEYNEPNNNFILYPNPIQSGNKLYLKLSSDLFGDYSLTLFNALGVKVGNEYKSQMSNSLNLEYDTSGLLPGIYFLSIKTRGKSIMKSFIVE